MGLTRVKDVPYTAPEARFHFREPVVMLDAAHCQRIEIAHVSEGWIVTEGGRLAGRFETVETAYQQALAICDDLFEQGVPSRVYELPQAA
ncbi:MAG: hypothetical protein B7Z12_19145 [Caulobacter vibrioides]|uniref:Uncharacterized protein n=2 Tax=Caulobacter vibrioides TaxID=155892 RepID=A0A258CT71_CAUVI|nr:MAG: hypothetical protein B7Z12_19145 [Caulobacter vibrioides]